MTGTWVDEQDHARIIPRTEEKPMLSCVRTRSVPSFFAMFFVSFLVLFAVSLHASPASALTISLDPSGSIVAPSDSVFLDIVASGVEPDVLGDFDIDVSFDPLLLTLSSVSLSGALGDLSLVEALDFSLGEGPPGLLNLAVVSLLPDATLDTLQASSFVLATIELMVGAIAPGAETEVVLAVNAVGNGAGEPLPIGALGSATLTAVPEPGTLALIGTGLVVLAGRRARPTDRAAGTHTAG